MIETGSISVRSVFKVLVARRAVLLFAFAVLALVSPIDSRGAQGTNDSSPNIQIWYGLQQKFGHVGRPQRWVNILGNASDPDGISSLKYSLNSGPHVNLSIGPDGRRLAEPGDFNVDIDRDDLLVGLNQVAITAIDSLGNARSETVIVDYTDGVLWPINYQIDWSQVYSDPSMDIQDVSEVVDGQWTLNANGVRPSVAAYDRLVAIGDVSWSDYEVLVPITIHNVDHTGSQPGVGILMRWQGHSDDPVSGWQPKSGWKPYGAIGWWRYYSTTNVKLEFHETAEYEPFNPAMNTPYWFKIRVETLATQHRYSLKVWPYSQNEPPNWNLEHYEDAANDLAIGSFLLISHFIDATYGDVTVVPVGNTYTLTVSNNGNGNVILDPPGGIYKEGTVVTLTPQPDTDWSFDGWAGESAGELIDNGDDTWFIIIDGNKSVTASFAEKHTLTVSTSGQGNVALAPSSVDGKYVEGTVVYLTPMTSAGWNFEDWSGPHADDLIDQSDGTWSINMDGDKSVTANFGHVEYALTINIAGSGSVAKDPDMTTYHLGDEVILVPTGEVGWHFKEWSGVNAGDLVDKGDGTWSIIISGEVFITANFEQTEYHVTTTIIGQGLVETTPDGPYIHGTVVTLTAIPDPYWSFDKWTGNISGTDNPLIHTITDDIGITAMFKQYEVHLPVVVRH